MFRLGRICQGCLENYKKLNVSRQKCVAGHEWEVTTGEVAGEGKV